MRPGYAPQTTAVPVGTVTVDGVEREATRIDTVRELGGGGVPGTRAAAAAEGRATFAQLADASSEPSPSPWTRKGNWPPAPGSAVQMDAGTSSQSFRMLTGVVDTSSPGSDGAVTSSVIDPVDQLHRKVTLPSMLASEPPLNYEGPLRNVGLSSDYIVDTILRLCGVFSTPYQPASVKGVNVPGQGSLRPARGTCVTAGQRTDQRYAAQFLSTEWGWGIYDGEATYTPDGTFTAAAGAEISCMVSDQHTATADFTLSIAGTAQTFTLVVGGGRAVSAQHFDGSSTSTVATLPAASGWRRVTMRISAGAIWLGTDDGRSASGSHTAPSPVTTANVTQLRLRVLRGGRVGGIIAGNMPSGNYFAQKLSARLWAGTNLIPTLVASERIESRDALDVIAEIAEATCRAFWWDEDGFFQWMAGDYMLVRNPVLTLTSKDSLIELGWSESLADTYRQVTVDHEVPVVARSRTPSVTVWQGSGDSMESSETAEEIVAPPSNEEWIQVDSAPRQAGGAFMNDINRGRFSVAGGVRTDGNNTQWTQLFPGSLSWGIAPIGPFAWKFTYETAALPAGYSVQRAMPNDDAPTVLWQRWRNEKLPIIRAYARVTWADDSVSTGSGLGTAGVYQHNAGRWVQGLAGEAPQRIADFLAAWLCVPRVKAERVEVIHDPRLQVGDIARVRDEHSYGVELDVLVTRIEQSTMPGEQTMMLDFFVISGGPAWMTLGEHDAAQASTLAGHDSSQSGESLGEHDQNPLHTT